MNLRELMISYRAKHRLSQRELGQLAGVSLQTINSVENGLQKPSKVTEAKIRLIVEEESEEKK